MAESTFETARVKNARKTWRTALIAAAVPMAMFAAAPAVSAAETAPTEVAEAEQVPPGLPPLNPGAPPLDPTALLDLSKCLTDLQAALPAAPPAQTPKPSGPSSQAGSTAEAEQAPPALPDVKGMLTTCQTMLDQVKKAAPVPGAPAPGGPPGTPAPGTP